MRIRKKTALDGIDREILRLLYKRSPIVSREIAKRVGLSAPAITPRLNNLKKQGLIKNNRKTKERIFRRKFNNKTIEIKAQRSIHWSLDLIDL
jgi:DNA-binding Lrp family transcriptional regulator